MVAAPVLAPMAQWVKFPKRTGSASESSPTSLLAPLTKAIGNGTRTCGNLPQSGTGTAYVTSAELRAGQNLERPSPCTAMASNADLLQTP